jgi:hypothetical protein
MANQKIQFQAKVYVFDLNNCANEHGFKTDEGWELSLATNSEKSEIEKKYYPTMSAKVLPEILVEFFRMVKTQLNQAKSDIEEKLDWSHISYTHPEYLIAFNPKRHR